VNVTAASPLNVIRRIADSPVRLHDAPVDLAFKATLTEMQAIFQSENHVPLMSVTVAPRQRA